jgi:hypothetical protein
MDFYFDEQLPKIVAESLNVLERHLAVNNVYSTEMKFGKGIPDLELFPLLKEVNGILITNDLRMMTRREEFSLLKNLGVTAFMISLPSGARFEIKYQTLVARWEEIKLVARKNKMPFICRMKMRGKNEFL